MKGIRYYHEEQIQKGDKVTQAISPKMREWFKKTSKFHSVYDVSQKLSLEDLLEFRILLQEEIDQINIQLATAKQEQIDTGKYADAKWFKNATHAKRVRGRHMQEICLQIGKLKKANKKSIAHIKDDGERGWILSDKNFGGLTRQDWQGYYKVMDVVQRYGRMIDKHLVNSHHNPQRNYEPNWEQSDE